MKVYLLRHGKADWPSWNQPDDERPLTKEGRKEVAAVGKFLKRLGIDPIMMTSPLPRASETANIVGKYLEVKVRAEAALRPGFEVTKLRGILRRFDGDSLMIVGHEPDFSRIIFQLTGARAKMSKAGLALIELEADSMRGELRWLVPPKLTK